MCTSFFLRGTCPLFVILTKIPFVSFQRRLESSPPQADAQPPPPRSGSGAGMTFSYFVVPLASGMEDYSENSVSYVRPELVEGPFMVRQAHHERYFHPLWRSLDSCSSALGLQLALAV